jgi:glycosyltransferase involved in cell wall biosynthesis
MKPLVSIIIPLYNAENYIEQTITSALKQTYEHLEIIIIDDGSTDNSLAIAKRFQNNKLKVFGQKNKGASAARNFGLENASGKYIQFLDADDLLSGNKIELQVKILENNEENCISYCSTIHFDEGTDHLTNKPNPYEEAFVNYSDQPIDFMINLWGGNTGKGSFISVHAWLTPKSIINKIGPWDENLNLDDDGEFFGRIALNANKLLYVPNTYSYYRKQYKGNNLSTKKNRAAYLSLINSNLSKKKNLLGKTNSFAAKAAIYRLLVDVAIECYINNEDIYEIAQKELPLIKYPFNVIVGGQKLTKLISKYLGWRTALRLQSFYHGLKN